MDGQWPKQNSSATDVDGGGETDGIQGVHCSLFNQVKQVVEVEVSLMEIVFEVTRAARAVSWEGLNFPCHCRD